MFALCKNWPWLIQILAPLPCAIHFWLSQGSYYFPNERIPCRTRKPRSVPASKDLIKKESPAPEPLPPPSEFPLVYEKTQYIICIGNERLSYEQRTRTFKRVSHIWDHVEDIHLSKLIIEGPFICHYPVYKARGWVVNNVMWFKNHVARVHGINLRP